MSPATGRHLRRARIEDVGPVEGIERDPIGRPCGIGAGQAGIALADAGPAIERVAGTVLDQQRPWRAQRQHVGEVGHAQQARDRVAHVPAVQVLPFGLGESGVAW